MKNSKRGRRSGRGRFGNYSGPNLMNRPYVTIVEKMGGGSTAAAAFSTSFPYANNVITGADLAISRLTQMRYVQIKFEPYAGSQPLAVQLYWETIDGTDVVMTEAVPLKTTQQTTLSYRLPFNSAEFRVAGDPNTIFGIKVYNRVAVPTVQIFLFHYACGI
jgi:hypothetical protein